MGLKEVNLDVYLKEKRQIVDAAMKEYLNREPAHPLSEIFEYCLTGGKRFRPILVMAAAEACGADGSKVMPAALAMEMIHNFSLVHDDLPCMDNDDYRRGIETCHKKFGETDALLAGDAILISAFEMLAGNAEIDGISPGSVVKVVKLYAGCAAQQGMTGGQVLDMHAAKNLITPDKEILSEIHNKKTGALITASVMAGGILGGASEDQLSSLETYGKNIGLTYQIIDDILDMETDPEKNAISFPAIYGYEESRQMAFDATDKAVKSLETFGEEAEPLRKLALYLRDRKQ
ncbi:MAG: polyprenyl synthetase family protein [Firmicutes bacterium]|nr:polyprenyl synthetase family protein [Bacillota bacterium]